MGERLLHRAEITGYRRGSQDGYNGEVPGLDYVQQEGTNTEPTIFYVVRHGETEWNLLGKQQGHMDSPLTERGVRQARALADGLSHRGIEAIYSSDLTRTLKTADIINERLKLSIQTDKRLRERRLGILQGLTMEGFRHEHEAEWERYISGDPDYCMPHGESRRQHYERTAACLENLSELHQGQTVLIVAHGGALAVLFHRCVDLPLRVHRRFSIRNAAINSFSIRGDDWHLDTWGEISHLRGIKALDDN